MTSNSAARLLVAMSLKSVRPSSKPREKSWACNSSLVSRKPNDKKNENELHQQLT